MSREARPISPTQFALAVQDLPIENIYSKALEINNSIAHLEHSNSQLQQYSDSIKNDTSLDATTRSEGDKDCLDAIRENKVVIERQRERVGLLKAEVERRGGRWHEADADASSDVNGSGDRSGQANGASGVVEVPQVLASANAATATNVPATNAPSQVGGRLTDDELRRQMEERLGTGSDDEGDGLHL